MDRNDTSLKKNFEALNLGYTHKIVNLPKASQTQTAPRLDLKRHVSCSHSRLLVTDFRQLMFFEEDSVALLSDNSKACVTSKPSGKLLHLQGIRGIAILAVILFHFYPTIFSNGYLGVDM
ncbi:hypothetical protein ENBRE01_3242 [Enteropsectra breve]|nr:hypothetical protein ENBRE01_3242 [Enteropsectra breve]